jgi:hypothetical protein
MMLFAIIAPASPAAFAVSDPRRLASCGSYRRLSAATRVGGASSGVAGGVDISPLTVPNAVPDRFRRARRPVGSIQFSATMARTRPAATLLAMAVLFSLAGAGAALAAHGTLTPTPPVSLPAHHHHSDHGSRPAPSHRPSPPSGLPNTGINARAEAAVALLMLGFGAVAKAFVQRRPAIRGRQQ